MEQHVDQLAAVLQDAKQPLKERFRALFTLRNIGGADAIAAIGKCFDDASALFKHECAYCLGQMQDGKAIPTLSSVLEDDEQDVMVRHEAAEALGAIGSDESTQLLEKYKDHELPEISETCVIALDRIRWAKDHPNEEIPNPYMSVDPAPPADVQLSIDQARDQLLNTSLSLFDRYRAMFTLRNIGTAEAVKALVDGFHDKSALFRHEIAYVLGQMQHKASVDGLLERLKDNSESPMVRHECAEALGSIATEQCLPVLQQYAKDEARVVRESCEVALDMYEYEQSDEFQYANTLAKLKADVETTQ